MNKKILIFIPIALILLIAIICIFSFSNNTSEVQTIKSEKQLLEIYEGSNKASDATEFFTNLLAMPFSFLSSDLSRPYYKSRIYDAYIDDISPDIDTISKTTIDINSGTNNIVEESSSGSSKDYSTTNIQVENVDEADITKTDGDFIYSISDNKVIITNVKNPESIKIESTITISSSIIPEDLLLYKDKLVVIASNGTTSSYKNSGDTVVKIYDITDKSNPKSVKSYELNEPYYTSRCINNQLYVISSGRLKKEGNKIDRSYTEDNNEKQIELNNIKYLKDVDTNYQTIFSVADLDNLQNDIKVNSYLIDISNSYVSENNIYLLDQNYQYSRDSRSNVLPLLSKLFGPGGIIGFLNSFYDYDEYYYDDIFFEDSSSNGYNTDIFKFNISNDGNISYDTKSKVKGKTINQYSLDEKNDHLRIALYDNDGARVVILNEKLEQIGETSKVAKGEQMYSSRFMDNKAYLVTYRNTDPLFVIDLSDESNPKVLGELHIPGYSTYLHPYDDTHLIGIGMETEETVNRNSSGKVTSTSATIIGMKMALFDVSDVKNPVQISQTVIGDRRTTSAILTNPKALLFSKEKQLIAIPVNNYNEDFKVESSSDEYSSIIDSYKGYNKNYIAEGYFVYNINLTDGFKLKGVITHDASPKKTNYYSYYSKLLRGLYIDNNLYTVSETAVKVNKLDTLEQISELKIK